MESEVIHRPKWEIDTALDRLLGAQVRVAAEAFTPARWNGKLPGALIPVRELILPDNRRAGSLPVYFEGRLQLAVRTIGVVYLLPRDRSSRILGRFGGRGGPFPRRNGRHPQRSRRGAIGLPVPGRKTPRRPLQLLA